MVTDTTVRIWLREARPGGMKLSSIEWPLVRLFLNRSGRFAEAYLCGIAIEFPLSKVQHVATLLICVAVLQHVDFIIAEHRHWTSIFAKVGLF